ncbi:hypothetical protein DEDE109153_13285 [Deinococcus deserti]|uniref:Uncharacterized protein n=1 Tax=Deinococcus deserti (strain DSM 17065 / CIP 109153 / LMG 22923 / VCD115) TaxID=546414 RepID=C1CZ21_DEIDV|nr:hypothetical protein [Deinococcus deserti]ACO45059.1 Conserved hypothetical protein, precursor [Deinococcus deserti VCD115]
MHNSKIGHLLALLGMASVSTAFSASVQLNQLMIMMDEPTPCQGVAVRFVEGSKNLGEFTVLTNGVIKPRGPVKTFPPFEKGKNYHVEASCISTTSGPLNSSITFKADGRTVMLVFKKMGFMFKRGGLAY